MSFFTKKQFVILSAERSELNHFHNEARTQDMRLKLAMGRLGKPFNFVEAQGVYKGTKEKSFMVEVQDRYDMLWIKRLAEHFKQESILYVNEKNQATLLYLESKKIEKLGIFHKVPKSVADNLEAYTMTNEGYYAC